MMREVYWSLGGMFTGEVSLSDLSGPVGTTQAISQVSKQGMGALTYFAVFISINLGIVNLLPVPPLDGGKIVVEVIQRIVGRDIPVKVINGISVVVIALLLLLFVVMLRQDIIRFVLGG